MLPWVVKAFKQRKYPMPIHSFQINKNSSKLLKHSWNLSWFYHVWFCNNLLHFRYSAIVIRNFFWLQKPQHTLHQKMCNKFQQKKNSSQSCSSFYGLLVFYRNIPLLHLIVLFDSHKWDVKELLKYLSGQSSNSYLISYRYLKIM